MWGAQSFQFETIIQVRHCLAFFVCLFLLYIRFLFVCFCFTHLSTGTPGCPWMGRGDCLLVAAVHSAAQEGLTQTDGTATALGLEDDISMT